MLSHKKYMYVVQSADAGLILSHEFNSWKTAELRSGGERPYYSSDSQAVFVS
jgi:hypothetical protein